MFIELIQNCEEFANNLNEITNDIQLISSIISTESNESNSNNEFASIKLKRKKQNGIFAI